MVTLLQYYNEESEPLKIAFLFPGQGAQYVGMGLDLYEQYPAARAAFDEAREVIGSDLIEIIFNGPEEKLMLTEFTQPAILTVSVAIYRVLEEYGFEASGFAGLSLGEYSALVAAKAINFAEALPLVQKRGIYMQEAVPSGEGSMTALMGLGREIVEDICRRASSEGLVAPANYNCPGQIVISGQTAALARAVELASKAGAKKISKLKVSAPFHCSLLQPVEARLAVELNKIEVSQPSAPVIFNVSARIAGQPDEIRCNLINQVSNPILWEPSIRALIAAGINCFIGIGPGNSLSRLMKRIAPEMLAFSVENIADLENIGGIRK
jgi:[acyl-carrier-protein] S-malonyltransferase